MALEYFKAAVAEVRQLNASLRDGVAARSGGFSAASPAKRPVEEDAWAAAGIGTHAAAIGVPPSSAKRPRRDAQAPHHPDPYAAPMIKEEGIARQQPSLELQHSALEGSGPPHQPLKPAAAGTKPPRAELVPVTPGYAVKTPSPSRRSNRTPHRRRGAASARTEGEGELVPLPPHPGAADSVQQRRLASEPLSHAGSYADAAAQQDDGMGAAAEEALPDEAERACNLCHSVKPLCEFYKVVNNYGKGSTKYATRCKDCIRTDAHRWFDLHRDSMMKVCDKCGEMKCVGEYNMTINYTVFKYAYNHGGAWDRGLERYCRKCTYKHQKEAGIIARKQAKRRERAYGRQQVTVTEKRCSKCGDTKAAELFPKDKYMVDGLYIYCKPCTSAMKKKQKADRLAAQAQMQLKEKECRKCSQVKPVDAFRKSPSNRDGRVNVCKDCQIQQERVRREIQRFNGDDAPYDDYDDGEDTASEGGGSGGHSSMPAPRSQRLLSRGWGSAGGGGSGGYGDTYGSAHGSGGYGGAAGGYGGSGYSGGYGGDVSRSAALAQTEDAALLLKLAEPR